MSAELPSGIVGVVRADEPEHALTIARGLDQAGIAAIEITFTVPQAPAVIRELAGTTRARLGAGTVRDSGQCEDAIAAGASFVVSPVFDPDVVATAARHQLPAVPGALTPTEVAVCMAAGAAGVKVFPISAVGGPAYVRTLGEAMPGITWMVSGGIEVADIGAYLAAGVRMVSIGGAIIDRDAARRGDTDAVTAHARAALGPLSRGQDDPTPR